MKYNLRRIKGDMMRFGWSPCKLAHRLSSTKAHPVFCNTIPKCGTHLLERVLCLHPQLYRRWLPTIMPSNYLKYASSKEDLLRKTKPSQIIIAHWRNRDPEMYALLNSYNFVSYFLIRDLRDVLISDVRYSRKLPKHHLHHHYEGLTLHQSLVLRLKGLGQNSEPAFGKSHAGYTDWLKHAHVVRFEDLVIPARQQTEVKRIFRILGIELTEKQTLHIVSNMVSSASPTFNKGTADGWKKVFDNELIELFKEHAGELLIQLGYEKDMNW